MQFPHITITRRRKLKYLRLMIKDSTNVHCTVPIAYSDAQVRDMLLEKREWILKHIRLRREREKRSALRSGDILFLGQECKVEFAEFAEKDVHWCAESGIFTLRGNLRPCWRQSLAAWQKNYAKKYITNRVHALSAAVGYTHGKITIRSQRSRWGSCAKNGNLSFNWKLIKAPPSVLNYVIYHELAHLKVFDHSPDFWALVALLCPTYEREKMWLREKLHLLQE